MILLASGARPWQMQTGGTLWQKDRKTRIRNASPRTTVESRAHVGRFELPARFFASASGMHSNRTPERNSPPILHVRNPGALPARGRDAGAAGRARKRPGPFKTEAAAHERTQVILDAWHEGQKSFQKPPASWAGEGK